MAVLTRVLRLAALLFLIPACAHADAILHLHEQEIEAGLIYNFLKYVEWPAEAGAVISVCVYGDDPFEGYLQPMQGRTVNERRIDVRHVYTPADTAGCNLLFVNPADRDQWPQLQKYLAGKNILTVSDFDDFAQSGGMIEFGRSDDHIRVSLNIDALTAANLKVEDRLLKLVTVLHASPAGGP